MTANIQPVLYIDPQSLPPRSRCRNCGEVCYGKLCLRCERSAP